MSLINQMLKDLESRNTSDDLTQRAIEGMGNATQRNKSKQQSMLFISLLGLILVLAGFSGYLLWQENQTLAQPMPAANPALTAAATAQTNDSAVKPPVPSAKPIEKRQSSPPLVEKADDASAPVNKAEHVAKIPSRPERQVEAAQPASPVIVRKPKAKPPLVEDDVAQPADVHIQKRLHPQTPEQLAEKHYQAGYSLLQQGDQRGAESNWKKALDADPGHSRSRESLAILYLSQSRRIEAAAQLKQGLARQPSNSTLALIYARMQLDDSDTKGAVATLESAMRQPQSADFYAFLAAVYQQQRDFEKSIAAYQRALQMQPKQGVWWMGTGISMEGAGKKADALSAYKQAKESGRLAPKLMQYVEERIKALD